MRILFTTIPGSGHFNPLVPWLWLGVLVMLLGTVLALFPNAAPIRSVATSRVRVPVHASAGAGD